MKKERYSSLVAPLGKSKRSLISSHGAQTYGGSGEYSSHEFDSLGIELIDMSHTLVAGCWSGLLEWYDPEARFGRNSNATMVEQRIVHSLGIFRTSSGPPCHQEAYFKSCKEYRTVE